MGIEGFWESAAAELAPFGIGVTLVERGVARTNFGAGDAVLGAPLREKADGPSGPLRRMISGGLPPAVPRDCACQGTWRSSGSTTSRSPPWSIRR